jgi:L-ascorbate metabolism protein UlaG (beta-lactamase superfamily)
MTRKCPMERFGFSMAVFCLILAASAPAQEEFPFDVIKTAAGDLTITFIGHGSLLFAFGGKIIHVDPYGKLADYGALPKADVILITHEHRDHLDPEAIGKVRKAGTQIIVSERVAAQLGTGTVMRSRDRRTVEGISIEAVPAYNLVHKRESGEPFHPRGNGNGYVITFGDKRVYVAGDTENIPEMKGIRDIDIAFLPMNLPYTMTPEMVADAAKMFKPRMLYPYHTGDTDVSRLTALMQDQKAIEVRFRDMK